MGFGIPKVDLSVPPLGGIKTPTPPSLGINTSGISDQINTMIGSAKNFIKGSFNPLSSMNAKRWPEGPAQEMNWFELGSNEVSAVSDAFFNFYAMDGTDFRNVYPYQLVISGLADGRSISITLPIAPQNISMNVPVATSIAVTMKGITEDNNGAPLRSISIAATTGVLPISSTGDQRSSSGSSVLEYAFKNTIQAVNRVGQAVNRAIDTIGGIKQQGPLNYQNINKITTNTGYFFFHNLQRFLDFYIALKKTRDGRKARLTFLMHKDAMYWDVILNSYSFTKQAGTLEYFYTINMTAYRRRTKAFRPSTIISPATQSGALNWLAGAVTALRQTRVVVAKSVDVLKGIRADVNDSFFTPMREIIMLASDVANAAQTIADFPQSLVNGMKASMTDIFKDTTGPLYNALNPMLKQHGLMGDSAMPGSSDYDVYANTQNDQGNAVLADPEATAHPTEKVFADPIKFMDVFDAVPIDQMILSNEMNNAIEQERARVRNLQITDIKQRRDTVVSYITSVSAGLGGSSTTYNRVYDLPTPSPSSKTLSVEDILLLSQLNDTVMLMDKTIHLMQQVDPTPSDDYFLFYADYATTNGLVVPGSNSKFYVPFPYGSSLESLAVQYLDDVNRWHEIAALNALKEPYIDEVGFDIPFTSNGSGNTAILSSTDNLYINEVIEIRSDTQPSVLKKIKSIDRISSIETIVTFDGDAILSSYKLADNARVHAYAPNTVNSTRLIAIPSVNPVNVQGKIKLAPGIQDLNKIAQIAKVDFLLQSSGDLTFVANDVRLASGMTNLIQAATLRLQTRQGEMLQFPDYGNPVQAGDSVAGLDLQGLLNSLNVQFNEDPRFGGILAARLRLQGPAVTMDLLLGVSNTGVNLPITTNLPV